MRENTPLIKNKNTKKAKEKLAQNYLEKYLKELQVHFNLDEKSIRKIIIRVYNSVKFEKPLNKILNMLKFFR